LAKYATRASKLGVKETYNISEPSLMDATFKFVPNYLLKNYFVKTVRILF